MTTDISVVFLLQIPFCRRATLVQCLTSLFGEGPPVYLNAGLVLNGAGITPRPIVPIFLITDQTKDRLCRLVRLGQHRCPSLLQDVEAGQLRALTRHIHIDDPAICCFQVDLIHRQHICRKRQSTLLCSIIGT